MNKYLIFWIISMIAAGTFFILSLANNTLYPRTLLYGVNYILALLISALLFNLWVYDTRKQRYLFIKEIKEKKY